MEECTTETDLLDGIIMEAIIKVGDFKEPEATLLD
jgi:hypothetical protein